jgi:hypothetical protein
MMEQDALIGLGFEEARRRVLAAFQRSIGNHNGMRGSWMENIDRRLIYWILANLSVVLVFFVSFGLNQESTFQSGLLISAIILLLALAVNVIATMLYRHYSKNELSRTMMSIFNHYETFIHQQAQQPLVAHNMNTQIPSGHSQLSIVNTYRNGQWMKLPVLLLAEGDVIALMGGDITPCRVYELLPIKDQANVALQDNMQQTWRPGPELEAGVKILINKHPHHKASHELKRSRSKSSAQPMSRDTMEKPARSSASAEKHRSLGPESTEILRLSGDIRCFLIAETPIDTFVTDIYTQSNTRKKTTNSYFDQVLELVQSQGLTVGAAGCILLIIAIIIRLSVFSESRHEFVLSTLSPIATVMLLLLPVSLPLILICAEAMGTAEILSTLEVALHQRDRVTDIPNNNGNINPSSSRLGSTNQPSAQREGAADREDLGDDDEFVDEDIDQRAEDIAEQTDTQVEYRRFFLYAYTVLCARLFGRSSEEQSGSNNSATSANKRPPLLPIPLASQAIVDQLGAITMVCFVDDDVICENYSVTEEIFLLTEKPPGEGDNPLRPRTQTTVEALGKTAVKGTVLDLHANPEATGSRFENPLWWQFLPSLKPLGVNALLTYKHTSSSTKASSNGITTPTPPSNTTLSKSSSKQSLRYIIERALVQHIQQTLPLEALRELSEEIGFVEDDIQFFRRAVEVNVIASGLENAHLLEDTHQWGQEESRRRGMLLPQLRGAVYQDQRGDNMWNYLYIIHFNIIL